MKRLWITLVLISLTLSALACKLSSASSSPSSDSTALPQATAASKPTFTPLPAARVQPGEANPDEPVFISGEIPYTSRFFLDSLYEPFVMLEDEAGFAKRDLEFVFSRTGQLIGPVEVSDDLKLTYSLSLPSVPQGTSLDVDNNGKQDTGVQVFAVAYWSNTWRDPFLEPRDGKGWSNAYASTITDSEREYEISGGTLVVWSPDDAQAFPTGFGPDKKLFTEDDPTAPIPAGYNLVDLNQEPFRVYKEARPVINLIEGASQVNDYSSQRYSDAFNALFDKASREYPFTDVKGIDWQALKAKLAPQAEKASTPEDFYRVLRDLSFSIPDGHVNLSLNRDVFYQDYGGGFGLVLVELSDGRVIATDVLPDHVAAKAGLVKGAEITQWDGKPVSEAIQAVIPGLGPYSTDHTRRVNQVSFLTRVPPGTSVQVSYKNPGDAQEKQVQLDAEVEYDSLFRSLPSADDDPLALPIEARTLPDSGLGYIRINTFSDDDNLMAHLWDRYLHDLVDNQTPGLILDLRQNSGGSGGMANNFAGYFFKEAFEPFIAFYYNDISGQFEQSKHADRVDPAPINFPGPIAVLVGPDCVSACEGFAYTMQHDGRAIIVGHYPSAGAYGEVGQGQYKLPDDLSMQFPTGRYDTPDGKLAIEGVGVVPDITVPVTVESALGQADTVLQAAVDAILKKIK
jgi:C-terminal processing protease CtpA/Prc